MKTSPRPLDLLMAGLASSLLVGPACADFHFELESLSVDEAAGDLTVAVVRDNPAGSGSAWLEYATSDVTATAGDDYEPVAGRLDFAAGEGSQTVSVRILNDALTEGPESLLLTLTNPHGSFLGQPSTLSVRIEDNDPGLRLEASSYPVGESDGSVSVTILRGDDVDLPVTVAYRTEDETATAGVDYQTVTGMVSFGSGEASHALEIGVLNDGLWESTETFRLVLTDPASGTSLGEPSTARIQILDNDPGVSFASGSYAVSEADGTVLVDVLRGNDGDFAFSVDLGVSAGSAVFGEDHGFVPQTLTFASGELNHTVSIPILNDGVKEPLEVLQLELRNATGGAIVDGRQWAASIWIEDNDQGFTFLQPLVSTAEEGGEVTLTVLRGNDGDFPVEVDYSTSDGTAGAGIDYTATSGRLTFAPDQPSQNIAVPILNDSRIEGTEAFQVTLSNPSVGAEVGDPASANVRINDNDPGIGFAAREFGVAEGEEEVVCVVLRGSDTDLPPFSVHYATEDLAAVAGEDYESVAGVLDFAAGATEGTIVVPILNDGLREATESFRLTLSEPSAGFELAAVHAATVEIVDNDPGVHFEQLGYAAREDFGKVTVTVLRGNDVDLSPVSFDLATVEGTASAGDDYVPLQQTLTFAEGEERLTVDVELADDQEPEPRESFTLTLSNPTGAGARLARPIVATISIEPDDARVLYDTVARAAGQSFSFVGGELTEVAVAGDYAYVAGGAQGLVVFDLRDPRAVYQVYGGANPGTVRGVAVQGNYAYLGQPDRLLIVDVSDPFQQEVGSWSEATDGWGVTVAGTVAYLADGRAGLQVIDVSDPALPNRIGNVDTPGAARAVVVVGSAAYVADGQAGLQLIDVNNPAQPQLIAGLSTGSNTRGLAVGGNYVYLACQNGLHVTDVSNPANPQEVASLSLNNATAVALQGSHVFAAHTGGMAVIDVSDPVHPSQVQNFSTDFPARGLAMHGSYAVVVDGINFGLSSVYLVDALVPEDPHLPRRPFGFTEVQGVAIRDDVVFLATGNSGLQALDVSDRAQPILVDVEQLPGSPQPFATGVFIQDTYAFVEDPAYQGFHIFDIADATTPSRVGGYNLTEGQFVGLAVDDGFAYLTTAPPGLEVVDIKNPADPKRVGYCEDLAGQPQRLAAAGPYVYLAESEAGVEIIDVAEPTNPHPVGRAATVGNATDVAVRGDYAYVTENGVGLQVFDVSDPANPNMVTSVPSQYASWVTFTGDYAYVRGDIGLEVFDIVDPAAPKWAGGYAAPYWPTAVAVSEQDIFLGLGLGGLAILRAAELPPVRQGPVFVEMTATGEGITLRWERATEGTTLQRSTSLENPVWEDVADASAANTITLSISGDSEFFRLHAPQ